MISNGWPKIKENNKTIALCLGGDMFMRPLHALDISIENACHCSIPTLPHYAHAMITVRRKQTFKPLIWCVRKKDAWAPVPIRVTLATTIWAALLNSNAFLPYNRIAIVWWTFHIIQNIASVSIPSEHAKKERQFNLLSLSGRCECRRSAVVVFPFFRHIFLLFIIIFDVLLVGLFSARSSTSWLHTKLWV